jgi:catechol 2,3-dioxygenase-like lactoylglutathione lyase family enzyme
MTLAGIDHVNISTAKLAETRRFFIDGLGLTEGWRPDFPFPGAWLYQGDRAVVHLVEKTEPLPPSRQASLDHFAFAAQDYEATVARLKEKGVEFGAVAVPGSSIRQLFLLDPNGVTIELNFQGD